MDDGRWTDATPPPHYEPFDPPLNVIEMSQYTTPGQEGVNSSASEQDYFSQDHGLVRTRSDASYTALPTQDKAVEITFAPVSPAVTIRPSTGRRSTDVSSIKTMRTNVSRFRPRSDFDTQSLVEKRSTEIAQWGIHWVAPLVMVGLFIAGLVGAVGHHVFYSRLNGEPAAGRQLTMVRVGTALAFFTKAMLVGSVLVSYRQRIWHTFRTKAITIGAIDGLFAATENPLHFRRGEMLRNAKLASLMALCTWIIPLSAVLSPASLTTTVDGMVNQTVCPTVSTLNFTQEAHYDFRDEKKEFPGYSLQFYNTTDVHATEPGWFDYYDQPSKNARRLTTTSVYLRRPVSNENTAVKSCGMGWNCTYEIIFKGPGYRCMGVASGVGSNDTMLAAMNAPFNTSKLAPEGNAIYLADVDTGDYQDPQLPTNEHGEPQSSGPWPEYLGAFQTEPVLWIGQAIDTNESWAAESPYASRWETVRVPKIFRCEHYETLYSVLMKYTDGIQSAHTTNRTFLSPIVDTTLQAAPDGKDYVVPTSNYVLPNTNVSHYKVTAAYHAMGALLRNFLRGGITDDGKYVLTRSDISETRLIDQRTSYPVTDLMDQIQSVYEDMLITLLSEPHLVVAADTMAPCSKHRTVNVFRYSSYSLWVGYAISILVTAIFLVIGGYSMWENGVASDTMFSRIMVTTRNPTLDRLSNGACLGNDPFPVELRRTKLRFGVLLEDAREYEGAGGMDEKLEHCAFGTEGETKPIVKYGRYA